MSRDPKEVREQSAPQTKVRAGAKVLRPEQARPGQRGPIEQLEELGLRGREGVGEEVREGVRSRGRLELLPRVKWELQEGSEQRKDVS